MADTGTGWYSYDKIGTGKKLLDYYGEGTLQEMGKMLGESARKELYLTD